MLGTCVVTVPCHRPPLRVDEIDDIWQREPDLSRNSHHLAVPTRLNQCRRDCNQRKFGTGLYASIYPFKTGFCATETAISGTGLQSRRPGPHYMQLPRITVLDLALCEGRRLRLWRTPWRRCCLIHV